MSASIATPSPWSTVAWLLLLVVTSQCSPAPRPDVWAEEAANSVKFSAPITRRSEHAQQHRNGLADASRLWPGGRVPYVISNQFPQSIKDKIRSAMDELEANVAGPRGQCIRFEPRTNQASYLSVVKETGCHSIIGFYDDGPQKTSLGPGCEVRGVILHELLHQLGFYHEQNRPDRDQYVVVNITNVSPAAQRNFWIRNSSVLQTYNSDYDLGSIMHYDAYSMAADKSYPVLKPRPEIHFHGVMGQRFGLSTTDVLKVQRQYGCAEDTSHVTSDLDHVHHSCNFNSDTCEFKVAPPSPDPSVRDTNTQWTQLSIATPDGPKAGHTNGRDAFLYVSSDKPLMDQLQKQQEDFDTRTTTVTPDTTTADIASNQTGSTPSALDSNATVPDIDKTTTTSTAGFSTNTNDTFNNATTGLDITTRPMDVENTETRASLPVSEEGDEGKHTQSRREISQEVSATAGDSKFINITLLRAGVPRVVQLEKYAKPSLSQIQESRSAAVTSSAKDQSDRAQAVSAKPSFSQTEESRSAVMTSSDNDQSDSATAKSFSASLFSPLLRSESQLTCLQFALYQKGPSAHVTVYIAAPLFPRQPLSSYQGIHKDRWTLVRLGIHLPVGLVYQLEIQAGGTQGAVAIDDLYIFKKECD